MRGDGFSARRVEPGPNTNSISFGVKAEPPALPCRDDVVVESGAAASESCLPFLEMRSSIAAGGLVPTGEARFWDRGARWFVVRFYGLGQLVTSCSVFSEEIRWIFVTRAVLMPCQEKVLPSRVARGYMS